MKNKINIRSLVFGAVLGAVVMLSVGGAIENSEPKASDWEFKTLSVYNTPDTELNKVVTEGRWTVVAMSQFENRYTFLLKKKK